VRLVSVAEFADLHTRVCRPVGLTAAEIDTLVGTAVARLGHQYDLKNVIDLARYLLPTPVPVRWRRRMLGGQRRPHPRHLLDADRPSFPVDSSDPAADRDRAVAGPMCPGLWPRFFMCGTTACSPRATSTSPNFAIIKPNLEAGIFPRSTP
jgi:hypothetical protein